MHPFRHSLLIRRGMFVACSMLITSVLAQKPVQPTLSYRSVKSLTQNGLSFKDLNKNGQLDKYEDWWLPVETRVQALIVQMTRAT